MTLGIFAAALLLGCALGAADGALSPLRRKFKLPFTVITDVILALTAGAGAVFIMSRYSDGRIFAYALLAFLLGAAAVSYSMRKIIGLIIPKLPKRKKSQKKSSQAPAESLAQAEKA